MKTNINLFGIISTSAVLLIGSLIFNGCVKDAFDEVNPPNASATCSDQILNQGEYRIDCGGPCAPCPGGDPSLTVTIDSTWMPEASKKAARFWKARFFYFDYKDTVIEVTASDTFQTGLPDHITLRFQIGRELAKGVHEVSMMSGFYFSRPPGFPQGSVNLANAVVTITNRDDVNRLISGKFEINSQPQDGSGNMVVFEDGVFTDFPLDPPPPPQ